MIQLSLTDYAESVRLRDMGMNIAASADNDWLERARSVAEMLGMNGQEVTVNDVYAVVGLPDKVNADGSLFRGKNWKCVGYAQSARVKRHAGLIRRWVRA